MDSGTLPKTKITMIKAPHKLAATDIDDKGPAGLPIGEPVVKLRSKPYNTAPRTGVWEATPGKFRRQVKEAEFAHFIAGRCKFHHDGGETLEIEAGDAVFFPANTNGVWEIIETARKTYFIVPE